jgi:hypothetical protein
MPAVSQNQQQLFGAALAYKRGETKDVSDEVKKLANSMSETELKKFASTKHSGLPKKVAKKESEEIVISDEKKLEHLKYFNEFNMDVNE